MYESHDYAALGRAANGALLMTYEWGYNAGPPMAVAPLDKVRQVGWAGLSAKETGRIGGRMSRYKP